MDDLDPDQLIGDVIASRYRIEARIGHGAMGTVYRARHVKVGRAFAVKVLHPRLLADEKLRRRFDREAELAGKLHHINVVSVVDVGETPNGLRYLVMEYADGRSLFEIIGEGALPAARVVRLAQQLCDGLQHAHERGLIHRDFKPENVIVERDRHGNETAKIVDFGVSILRDDAASTGNDRLTTAGLILGTPHYMAPEHATGEAVDHRIDLFALGVICFEMVTGRLPFDGDGVDVARANLMCDTPPMGVRVPNGTFDPLLEAFTRKLMMKSRAARPASAADARKLLDMIDRDRPAAAAALGVELEPRPLATQPRAIRLPTAPSDGVPRPMGVVPTARVDPTPSVPIEPIVLPATLRTRPALLPHRRLAVIAGAAVATLVLVVGLGLGLRHKPEVSSQLAMVDHHGPTQTLDAVPIGPAMSVPVAEPTAAIRRSEPERTVTPVSRQPVVAVRGEPAAINRREPARANHKPQRVAAMVPPGPPASPPIVTPPMTPPSPPDLPTSPPVEVPKPVTAKLPEVTAPVTAASVAQLYASVGRQLKTLDQDRGSAATADLWPLFLRVRINDVIADPVKREEANALLHRLGTQIAVRAH